MSKSITKRLWLLKKNISCRKNSKKSSFLAILSILGVILTRLSRTQKWFFWKISFCKKSPLYMTIILCKKKWVLLEVHFYPFLGLFSRFKKAPLQAKQNNFWIFFCSKVSLGYLRKVLTHFWRSFYVFYVENILQF